MAIPKGGNFNNPPPKHGHDTHGDRHKGTTPKNPHGGGTTGGTAGHESSPPSGGYVGHPLAWVVRRQQVLRRAGFNIAVDGIYGPSTSRAWAAFLHGINHNSIRFARGHDPNTIGPPPGYVYYKGHVVRKEQATILRTIQRYSGPVINSHSRGAQHVAAVKQAQAAIALQRRTDRNATLGISLLHQAGQTVRTAKGYRRVFKDGDPQAVLNRQARRQSRMDRRALVREGIAQETARERARLDEIYGGDFKNRYLDPNYLLHRAHQGDVDASDLTFLMHDGLLSGDETDVRTIQEVINHDGAHVKVNGIFDQSTFDALNQLYNREARKEFAKQIDAVNTQFFHDGIARAATTKAYGVNHELLSPAELLHILQTGGPRADILGSALAHYVQFNQNQRTLFNLQEQRARQILGEGVGRITNRALIRDTLRASDTVQDQALGEANDLQQFSMILAIKEENIRRTLAMFSAATKPGFFSELAGSGLGFVGAAAGIAYHYSGTAFAWNVVAEGSGKLNDAWNWTGLTHNTQRSALTAGDLIASYTGGFDPTVKHPDGLSITEAWQQSEAHLSDLKRGGGADAFIFDTLIDPLNLVGGGTFSAAFDGIRFGARLGEIGAGAALLRSTESVDRLAPAISEALHDHLIRATYRVHTFGQVVHDEGFAAAIGDTAAADYVRQHRIYQMATVTRTVAQRAVEEKLAIVYSALRPAASQHLAVMAEMGGPEIATAADEIAQVQKVLPADFVSVTGDVANSQVSALRAAAPWLSGAMKELGVTLHLSPGGRLSFTGRRVRAWFMEQARRQASARFLILDDLSGVELDDAVRAGLRNLSLDDLVAEHANYFGSDRLDELMSKAGSWFGGGLPDDFYGKLNRELQLFRERLNKQILPAFDEMLLLDGATYPHVLPDRPISQVPVHDPVPEPVADLSSVVTVGGSNGAKVPESVATAWTAFRKSDVYETRRYSGVFRRFVESAGVLTKVRRGEELTDSEQQFVSLLNEAVSASPALAEPIRVYRGGADGEFLGTIRVGDSIPLGGVPTSMSTDLDVAKKFSVMYNDKLDSMSPVDTFTAQAFTPGGVTQTKYILDVTVSDGEHVAFPGGNPWEAEALLPSNSDVRITGIRTDGKHVYVTGVVDSQPVFESVGRVADVESQRVRDAIDRMMGFNVDELYNEANWVDAVNPNHLDAAGNLRTYRPDSARFRMRNELSRYEDSRADYADYLVAVGQRTAEDAAAWVAEKIATKRAEIESAWEKRGKRWVDTRPTVRVPKPTVGGLAATDVAHHADMRKLIDVTTSFDRIARSDFKHNPSPDEIQHILDSVGDGRIADNQWVNYVDASQRLEAAHAIAERQVMSQFYLDESLLWDGLREHQSRAMRSLYYGFAGSLSLWKTAVLPLRPAFVVRNVVDNQVKMMLEGYRDPALFFRQVGDSVHSVIGELMVRPMRWILTHVDSLLGSTLLHYYDQVIGRFWEQPSDLLEKMMLAHGIPHPPELFRSTLGDVEVGVRNAEKIDRSARVRAISRHDLPPENPIFRFKKYVWDLAASQPEQYQSRLLYVSKYRQEVAKGATEMEAMDTALKTVEKALFDYDQITVLEDGLKVIAPFIFFWRKNAGFWGRQLVEKPWFFYQGNKMYEAHRDSNDDQPEWMRRYVSLSPIASITDQVPGLQWASDYFRTANFDPLAFSSAVSFYRAFVGGNPELPADKQGAAFVSSLINGMDSVGLGINPFLRSVGARTGLLDMRAWQDVFPQTTVFQSLTSEDALFELFDLNNPTGPNGFNPEDWFSDAIFQGIFQSGISEQGLNYDRFQYFVGQEIAGQVARGEKPDRAAATAKIQRYLLFQNLTGFALGTFPRRITADDRQIYAISDKVRLIYADQSLSPAEQRTQVESLLHAAGPDLSLAYSTYSKNKKLFKAHGYSAAAFDRWLIGAKAAQAFFAIDDFDEQQKFLTEHPEALPIINPVVDGSEIPSGYIKNQILLSDTQAAIQLGSHFLDGIDAAFDVSKAIGGALVYPELRDFWAKNDTPTQIRQRQVAGAYFGYISKVNDTYFAIPENDFDARTNYLAAHPELQQFWAKNDTASDDYRAIQLSANSTFRSIYFRLVDAGDWDAADVFLRRHSFMFDFTSAEGRITAGGHWLPRSKAASDYAAVSSVLKTYYSFTDKKLQREYLAANPQLQKWFKMYSGDGGLLQEGQDYDKLQSVLGDYFALDPNKRAAFLDAHPELKAYFAKYSHNRSDSQHARDYLAVKPQLDAFFDLPDSERSAYLAKHPELSAYFAKYGHHASHGTIRGAIAADPEIKARYDFWTHFFSLPPNKRAAYVHLHAEDAGVFVYGSLAGNWRHDIEQKWHRDAIRFGHTEKAQAYVTIKPLMDIYFSLKAGSSDRALFLQTNPELQVYFETFSPTLTGSKKLDGLVKEYLRLPQFSAQRSQFIEDHPEISVYFNKNASPKEMAMQRLVDAYFALPFGPKRDRYLVEHPEVRIYFDQRHHQNDLFSSIAAAFNETDPRMAPFIEQYKDIIPLDAIKQFELRMSRIHEIVDTGGRRERDPERDSESQRRIDRVSG